MFAVEIYAAVRRFVFVEGKSRREAARVFGLSRDTIAKMCPYSAPPRRSSCFKRALTAAQHAPIVAALSFAALPTFAQVHGKQAVKVNDFLNSIGVNTKIKQGQDPVMLAPVLKYLGVRAIRDSYGAPVPSLVTLHQQTGVAINLLVGSRQNDAALPNTIADAKQLAMAGALLSIEGPNEPHSFGITYQGQSCCKGDVSWSPVAHFQRDFCAAAKTDPVLANYPVFGASNVGGENDNQGLQFLVIPKGSGTLMPDGTVFADFANVHNYVCCSKLSNNQAFRAASPRPSPPFNGEYQNHGVTGLKHFMGYPESRLPTLPRVTTETGWHTDDLPPNDDIQGRILLNVYLDQYAVGWAYTFVYQAVDIGSDNGWGFYRNMTSPRRAAIYLHRFTTFLADTSSAFTPGTVAYSISGQAATTHAMLMQKSTGPFELAVWGEMVSGNVVQTVDLGARYPLVTVYDPVANTVARFKHARSVTLTLTDHPMIIEFWQSSSPPPPPPPPPRRRARDYQRIDR